MMLLTIGALFITQAYWFQKTFSLKERELDERINISLRSIAHGIKLSVGDSSSIIPAISQVASNEYYVETNCYLKLDNLDSLIRHEFLTNDITASYDYYLVKPEGEIVLGNHVSNLVEITEFACKTREDEGEILNFKVRINDKTTYLFNSMGIWIFSSLSLLVLLAVFTFIMVAIFKGKKLANLKKDFVNNMTHELKTPIANISVASDAIRNNNREMDPDKVKKYADIIFLENERLHKLVNRVLMVATMEKESETVRMESIDLHTIIQHVITNFEPLILQRGGVIKTKLSAEEYQLEADKVHLTNVISNLIDNAIKYSIDNPEIEITTKNQSHGIDITISDKGIGISKENQDRIFEKFFRGETGDLHTTKGYGLGLNYVKLVLEKHNGTISFKSRENEGSNFTIFLPI